MDELSCSGRFTRRLALAAIICCSATSGYAEEPANAPASGASTFRTLLAEGWADKVEAQPAIAANAAVIKPEGKQQATQPLPTPIPPTAAATKPETGVALSSPAAKLIRPKLRLLEVPKPVREAGDRSDLSAESQNAARSMPQSLAELIKLRSKNVTAAQPSRVAEAIDVDLAPTVKRLDVDRQIANKFALLDEVEPNVHAADPIFTAVPEIEAPDSLETPELSETAQHPVEPSELAVDESSQPVATPTSISPPRVADVDAQRKLDDPLRFDAESPVDATVAKAGSPPAKPALPAETASDILAAESHLADAEAKESDSSVADRTSVVPESIVAADRDTKSHAMSARSPAAADNGAAIPLPLRTFEPETAVRLGREANPQTLTTTIHATRLREIARESLRNAHQRLHRRATHSAKKYALEALRSVVAMRDAQSGGNQHAKQLDAAFDAVRESEDFSGRFGAIDQSALKRMVSVHETEALKDRDLENLSALEAIECYLAAAKADFVQAVGDVREGSEALVMLGQIERQMAGHSDTYAAAVAVTLQRAAVEIEPGNALAYRELGTTLLHQGLVEQASWALNRSITIYPTRAGYQRLLEVSRRLGDVDTARVCLVSLQDPHLSSEIPIRTLEPQTFAATHRPNPASFQSKPAPTNSMETRKPKAAEPRVGLGSLFPFRFR